jgi:hypothetical protein
MAGDTLLAIDDVHGGGDDVGERFRAAFGNRPAGTPLTVRVRRAGEELRLTAPLVFADDVSRTLREAPNASAKALSVRRGILEGVTG